MIVPKGVLCPLSESRNPALHPAPWSVCIRAAPDREHSQDSPMGYALSWGLFHSKRGSLAGPKLGFSHYTLSYHLPPQAAKGIPRPHQLTLMSDTYPPSQSKRMRAEVTAASSTLGRKPEASRPCFGSFSFTHNPIPILAQSGTIFTSSSSPYLFIGHSSRDLHPSDLVVNTNQANPSCPSKHGEWQFHFEKCDNYNFGKLA